MMYDLQTQWFPTFEGMNMPGVVIEPVVGDKIPVDRAAKLSELNDMLDRRVISAAYYRLEAAKLGYVFPSDIDAQIAKDAEVNAIAADPFGARVDQEISPEE
jgi:hypothetical protein